MQCDEIHPEISAPAGVFKGSTLKSFCGQRYDAYRGIPFALPPVGPLRFERPVPQPKLEGVYDASEEGPISIQPIGVKLGPKQQEDCLYLNVFTPTAGCLSSNGEKPSEADDKKLKKVMVFIHGGCYFMGCANQHVPGDLVAQGDVIVVTLNYRLSWLGFLKTPGEEVKGNIGLWDQLEALNWVKVNIEAFGGDPDDLTVAGQSMGGESVSALSVMKQAKHLFTKGILMSGTMFTCRSTVGSSDVLLDKLTDKLGLSKEGKTCSEIVQELKALPEERFILPLQNEITNKFTTIDGEMFPKSFGEMKQDKEYLSSVGFYDRDYLVTLTNNEGQLVSTGPLSVLDKAKGNVSLPERLGQSESLHKRIYDWYNQPGHYTIAPLNDLFTDPVIMAPAFEFLQVPADPSAKGRSYFLWFDHMPSYAPDQPGAAGSVHSLDLCYLFDIVPDEIYKTYNELEMSGEFTEEDKRLKKLYIDMVVDFMHHGNSNESMTPHLGGPWPSFEAAHEYYLNFGTKPTIQQFPIKERRDLWKNVVPQWIKEENNSL